MPRPTLLRGSLQLRSATVFGRLDEALFTEATATLQVPITIYHGPDEALHAAYVQTSDDYRADRLGKCGLELRFETYEFFCCAQPPSSALASSTLHMPRI